MGWMGWRDFAGGEMTNWGAHGVDQIQWALGADASGPVAVTPVSEGPNGQVVMTYADGLEVKFVLDQALIDHDQVYFHPLHNGATTGLSPDGLMAFLKAVGVEARVLDFSNLT